MNGVKVNFIVDTVAERTIVSKKIFDKFKESGKPNFVKRLKLIHAGGQAIVDYGKCKVSLIRDITSILSDVIAKIQDKSGLGMYIFKGKNGKPADTVFSQNKILLNGQEINCQHLQNFNNR